jgi:hypothetical protein
VERRVLAECREDAAAPLFEPSGTLGPWGRGDQFRSADPVPLCAALHLGPAGLHVIIRDTAGMYVGDLDGARRRVEMAVPLDLFQAASQRNGSVVLPGSIDLVGASAGSPDVIRRAAVPVG